MQDYTLVGVIRVLYAWRKPLVAITLGAAIIAVVVTLLLPNYYKATTIFYAASQDLFKPQKVFGYSQNEMYYYGGTEDIQRLMTAAVSQPVTDYLVKEFDLYSHYHITQGSPRAAYKIQERLLDHYTITRTKYDALELSVEDTDPETASRMANGARDKLNAILTGIIKSSQRDLIKSYKDALSIKVRALTAIEDSLQNIQGLYGIYDPEAQAEFLSTLATNVETRLARDQGALESYQKYRGSDQSVRDSILNLTASIAGLEMQRKLLSGVDTSASSAYSLSRFAQGKGRVEFFTDAYEKAINALNVDKEIVKQMEAAIALDVHSLHLVEAAAIPLVKDRPHRTIIVLATTLIVFIFTVFTILLIESFKEQDWSFLKW